MRKLSRDPPLAKLSRPRIHRALARERLFERLDHSAARAVSWVVAPPGAGKTTLLASYLESRKLRGIWFQLDADDSEPSTFFYYLGEAERRLRGNARRAPLPLLTPEYLADTAGFARRFFRELYSRLGTGAALVFDNFQDIATDGTVLPLLLQGLAEVPEGVSMLVASRTDPPTGTSRLAANGMLTVIDWEEVKLTEHETSAIAAAQLKVDAEHIRKLHVQSGGWAAGLVLLIERLRRGEVLESLNQPEALQGVFAYFAEQFFQQSSDAVQRVLLQLSFMPQFTVEEAQVLTGTEESRRLLDQLYRRHLFLDRRNGLEPVYQFHALLHAFLRHQALHTMSPSVRMGIAQRAAQLLEASGQIEEAMRLHLTSRDLSGGQALILREAPKLIAQGRWQLLVDWIGGLPKEVVAGDRWMLYWLGCARIPVDPVTARTDIERAYTLAVEHADDLCELLSAAGMVHAHMLEYVAYRPLDRWIPVLEKVLSRDQKFPSLEAELNVQSALLVALAYRNPCHPCVAECVERLFELVHTGAEVTARITGALYLTLYGGVSGPSVVSDRAAPILRALMEQPGVSALNRAFGWFVLSFYYLQSSVMSMCEQALEQITEIGNEQGLPFVHRFVAIIGGWLALSRADFATAKQRIARLQDVIEPTNLYDVASVHWLKGQLAIQQLDADTAAVEAKKAVDVFDAAGTHFHRVTARNILVWSAIYRGNFAEARHWIADARDIAGPVMHSYTVQVFHAAEAWMTLDEGDQAKAAQALLLTFGPASQQYTPFMFELWRAYVPRLAGAALEMGIEIDAVRRTARHLACSPPSTALESWPWKVRIYILGRFEIWLDDERMAFGTKTPRKPLALLKALICLGGEARDYHLIDAIWPNEEADAARSAFSVALFRLRGLLGSNDIIVAKGGMVSLNRDLVWVDALAFDQLSTPAASTVAPENIQRALELYRGNLLPEDAEESWSAALRERLRGKFTHHLVGESRVLEHNNLWDDAIAHYLRGIDIEPLGEVFYQGLMRCYGASGRSPEGIAAYRRLSQVLSVTLGIKPSAETELLHQALLA